MDLLNLEQQRQMLEANLQQLRDSLKSWHIWEAEYEGLKEEILAFDGDLSAAELDYLARNYSGDLVDEQEIRNLAALGPDPTLHRNKNQILDTIRARQADVARKIEAANRKYFETEQKAEELAFAAASHGRAVDGEDAALPLTEIHEELDDDDNVLSSTLSRPEETTAQVVESLRKAGLSEKELGEMSESTSQTPELKGCITNASPVAKSLPPTHEKLELPDTTLLSGAGDGTHEDPERPSIRKKSVSFTADTKEPTEKRRPESEEGRKTVSFAPKVAVMPAAPPPDTRSVSFSTTIEEIPPPELGTSPNLQHEAVVKPVQDDAVSAGSSVERPQANATPLSSIVIPDDESEEDARTRREMLEYHLNEVGTIVAQIDLEEAGVDDYPDEGDDDDNESYFTTSEYLDDEDRDTPYTTGLSASSSEDEDEFGRSKGRVMSEEYKRRMRDLHTRLIGNLGPSPMDKDVDEAEADLNPDDVRRLVIREKRNSTSSNADSESSEKKSGTGAKKRVSFAEAVDVADEEPPASPPLKAQKKREGENVAPVISDTVSERKTAASHSLPQPTAPTKISRFKQAHANTSTSVLADGKDISADAGDSSTNPLAKTLIERPLTTKPPMAPNPEEPDELMQSRELRTEYYRQRNDIIRRQGGFKKDEEAEDGAGELMEEVDGKVKKVSRFKAARVKGGGIA